MIALAFSSLGLTLAVSIANDDNVKLKTIRCAFVFIAAKCYHYPEG